jgi:hypothetical protein
MKSVNFPRIPTFLCLPTSSERRVVVLLRDQRNLPCSDIVLLHFHFRKEKKQKQVKWMRTLRVVIRITSSDTFCTSLNTHR